MKKLNIYTFAAMALFCAVSCGGTAEKSNSDTQATMLSGNSDNIAIESKESSASNGTLSVQAAPESSAQADVQAGIDGDV